MSLHSNVRRFADEVWWRVRGVFAREEVRNVGFHARSLCQSAEMAERVKAGRGLAASTDSELRISDRAGYRVFDSAGLPDMSEVCARGRRRAEAQLASRTRSTSSKDFHSNKLALEDDQRELLKLALDRRVLSMVCQYLGTLPVLGDVDYFMSTPSRPPWKKSQLWHCDDDAPRQLKLFIYCDDVDDASGPFELIGAADSATAREKLGYRYAGKRYRVTDEEMDRVVARDHQLALRGARGTAFAVDTARCFHKGSRVTGANRHRMVAVVLYCTANGMKMPLRLAQRPGPYARFADIYTDPIDRAVLGLPLA